MMSFDFGKYLNSLNYDKNYVFSKDDTYVSFIVNRNFTYFPDTVFYSVDISMHSQHIPDQMNYLYWFNSIPKRRRYTKFFKKERTKEIEALVWAYDISYNKAEEYYEWMDPDDVKSLVTSFEQNNK